MRAKVTSWWTRPCGPHSVLAMALPLMISTLSWTVMNFVDRMFLLWHSTDSMAAALPAGVLQFAVLCPLLGVASYVNAFVAQYDGAGRPQRIGPIVWQGIWIGIFATPLLLVTIPLAPRLFAWAGHPPRLPAWRPSIINCSRSAPGPGDRGGAIIVFHRPRGNARGHGGRLFGRVAQRPAGVSVDFRPLGISGRGNRRGGPGHHRGRVGPRGDVCVDAHATCLSEKTTAWRPAGGWTGG